MRLSILTIGAATALAISGTMAISHDGHGKDSSTAPQAESIVAAVAREDRPEAARALDEGRKPAETLAWLGLETGMDVVDISAGGGYWSEIIAHVVSPDGSVAAFANEQFFGGEEGQARWDALMERAPGVTLSIYPFERFKAEPDSFDFAITNLNYHDLYWESERFKIERNDPNDTVDAIFRAMRPGGLVGVIDHAGPKGDGEAETRAIVEKLHRIAAETIIADFERAGFELVDQSDLLANPDDDHSLNVFNPEIRGKTDRFLLKFRKPEE